MRHEYILPLTEGTLETVGGKGASLARLAQAGLPVPDGFHITTAAYQKFVAENGLQPHILTALKQVDPTQPATLEAASAQIYSLFEAGRVPADVALEIETACTDLAERQAAVSNSPLAVAVRSSATAEDLPDLSFAGQQETFLNVCGVDAVQEAVKRCWASLWTARAIGYRARHGIDQATFNPVDGISLAVVVQTMVVAEAAGIMFTANPLNGNRKEAVINAAWGLGEAIVGGQVSPDTVIVDKATGQVKQIEVADKAVMTVVMTAPAQSGVTEQPVAESLRKARVLDDAQVIELVRLGRQIEALYDAPQDIEWCWADGRFFVVQSRPITTLDKAAVVEAPLSHVPPPREWEMPNPRARYMRNNIVELIPDPMTPLFGTLGRRVVNTSMNRLMAGFLGGGIMPEELIITIHDYAYYNGEFTAGQIWRILVGSVGIMKRMFTGAVERWHDARVHYRATVEDWQARPWREGSATEILRGVPQVLGAAIEYYGALVGGVIPAAWITEALFTGAYRLIGRKTDPPAPTYLLGFDSIPILAEKALYDLARWAQARTVLADYLSHTPTAQLIAQLRDEPAPSEVDVEDWREWQERFCDYLEQYGATIYDLDFAKPTPADDPAPVLEAYKLFLRDQGADVASRHDPHARQRAAAERREQAVQAMLDRLKGLRLRLFRSFLARAQKYAPLREDGLAELGLGYPLVRQMLLAIGQRLTQAGAIDEADDVFWLTEDEVERAVEALDRGEPVGRMVDVVPERKALWQAEKQVVPPVSLPLPPKFLMKLLPAQFGGQIEDAEGAAPVIRGTPCSPGSVTATARVLHGPQDFDLMQPGDVLVAAITTPAWTPLFAMASAIVTDVGGPLSHGSIVAREYSIPAVLGTGGATRRIKTGDRVRVDGGQGTVEVLG